MADEINIEVEEIEVQQVEIFVDPSAAQQAIDAAALAQAIADDMAANPILNQNNKNLYVDFFTDTDSNSISQRLGKINALTIVVDEYQTLKFRNNATRTAGSDPDFYFELYTEIYDTNGIGKGTYGLGGTPITAADLVLNFSSLTSSSDVESNPNNQIIIIPTLGSQTIEQYVNAKNPPYTIQSESLRMFKVTDGSNYIFTGVGGVYGVGGPVPVTADDFVEIKETSGPFVTSDDLQEVYDELIGLINSNSTGYIGTYTSLAGLNYANPTANAGNYAIVDSGTGDLAVMYIWDVQEGWVSSSVAPGGGIGKTAMFSQAYGNYPLNGNWYSFSKSQASYDQCSVMQSYGSAPALSDYFTTGIPILVPKGTQLKEAYFDVFSNTNTLVPIYIKIFTNEINNGVLAAPVLPYNNQTLVDHSYTPGNINYIKNLITLPILPHADMTEYTELFWAIKGVSGNTMVNPKIILIFG